MEIPEVNVVESGCLGRVIRWRIPRILGYLFCEAGTKHFMSRREKQVSVPTGRRAVKEGNE